MPRILGALILAIVPAWTALAAGSSPEKLTPVGKGLAFVATTPEDGTELWFTDGTRAGTVRLTNAPGSASTTNLALGAAGETIYFTNSARELWRSDGTVAGTIRLLPTDCSSPFVMGPVNGRTLIRCDRWLTTDGTTAGTREVQIDALVNTSNPPWILFDGAIWFGAKGAIYRTDGTAEGTALAIAKPGGAFFLFDGALYFHAHASLWRVDGNGTLTEILALDYSPHEVHVAVGRTAFYVAFLDSARVIEPTVWKSDGTAAGTQPVGNFSWIEGNTSRAVVTANGNLVFRYLSELWRSTGSPDGPETFAAHISPEGLVPLNGFAVASGRNHPLGDGVVYSRELWISDGTTEGTRLVRDIFPGGNSAGNTASSAPALLTPAGGIVYFTADDGRTGRELWRTDGTTRGTWLVANLAREGAIEGRVRDAANGEPLAGVIVQTWTGGSLVSETPTDSAGRFWSEGLGAETYILRTVNAAGYIDDADDTPGFPLTATQIATGVEIALSKGPRISGRVVDAATGAAIDNAAISIFNASNRLVTAAVSDASGAYVSDAGLPSGTYRVEVTHPNFNKTERTGVTPLSGVDLSLTRAGDVRGRVVDAINGRPVPSMIITVLNAQRQPVAYGVTAADGTYRVALPDGTYVVSVNRVEFPARYAVRESSSFTIASGQSRTVDLSLERAISFMDGRVLDAATGAPIRNAYVTAKHTSQQQSRSEYSDVEGRFSLQILAHGAYEVGAYHPYFESAVLGTPVTVSAGQSVGGLEIRMSRKPSIIGRVVDAQGQPVPGADISICAGTNCNSVSQTGGTGAFAARTSISAAGTYDVLVSAPGFFTRRVSAVNLPAGTEVDLGAMMLSRPFRVTGRVFDAQTGKPIAGARIVSRQNFVQATGVDGTFDFLDTGSGAFTVTVLAEGFATQRYPGVDCYNCRDDHGTAFTPVIDTVRSGIDFPLHRTTYITGRIIDAETGETVDATVGPLDESFRGAGTITRPGANGVYKTDSILGHGKFYVIADARPAYLLQYWPKASCEVEPGVNPCRFAPGVAPKTVESRGFPIEGIDFELQPRMVDATFEVLDAVTRAPVTGATVELFTQSGIPLYRSAVSDTQGKVRMRVSARVFWARVSAPGYVATVDNAACGNGCVVRPQLGTVDLLLTTTATLLLHRMAIHEIRPGAGAAIGGRQITIRGEGFQFGATVRFGDVAAQVASTSPTEIVVITPAGAAGSTAAVTVRNPDGREAKAEGDRGFRYLADAPCVPLEVDVQQVLGRSQWSFNVQVKSGGPTFNAFFISSPGRPAIALTIANSSTLLKLQDVERYANVRVTSACDEREFVFRLDKKKMRSVR